VEAKPAVGKPKPTLKQQLPAVLGLGAFIAAIGGYTVWSSRQALRDEGRRNETQSQINDKRNGAASHHYFDQMESQKVRRIYQAPHAACSDAAWPALQRAQDLIMTPQQQPRAIPFLEQALQDDRDCVGAALALAELRARDGMQLKYLSLIRDRAQKVRGVATNHPKRGLGTGSGKSWCRFGTGDGLRAADASDQAPNRC
jgi:hypothetical protein